MIRIIFMGTPDFGIPTLQALIDRDDYEIVGVFTQPDKPRGRKSKLTPCPIKKYAIEQGLDVYSYQKVRARLGREKIESLKPDVLVTAAFGQILSQRILDIPLYGCVNIHGSLLPAYRGAAPIQWAIINGEKATGITTMLTERGVDSGNMLLKESIDILPNETAGELFDRLSLLGGKIIIPTIEALINKTITPQVQDESLATNYPMLTKQDGKIDWNKSAQQIHDLVRGVNPWPGAFCFRDDNTIKIWATDILERTTGKPGMVVTNDKYLDIACGSGTLRVIEMQVPGKRRMNASDVLRGYRIEVGEILK